MKRKCVILTLSNLLAVEVELQRDERLVPAQ